MNLNATTVEELTFLDKLIPRAYASDHVEHYYPIGLDQEKRATARYLHKLIYEAGLYKDEEAIMKLVSHESGKSFDRMTLYLVPPKWIEPNDQYPEGKMTRGEASIGLTQLNLVGKYGYNYWKAKDILQTLTRANNPTETERERVKNLPLGNTGKKMWEIATIEYQM